MTARKRGVDGRIDDTSVDRGDSSEGGRFERDLRRALDNGEIAARYRPVVRTADGSLAGLEVEMVRDGAGDGSLTRDRLVLRAARAGLATHVDERALKLTLRDVRRGALPHGIDWVAVGLSSRSLRAPQMVGRVLRLSGELGKQGRELVVELSTRDPDLDLAEAALGLSRLRSSGVRVALDHLGGAASRSPGSSTFPWIS